MVHIDRVLIIRSVSIYSPAKCDLRQICDPQKLGVHTGSRIATGCSWHLLFGLNKQGNRLTFETPTNWNLDRDLTPIL